MGNYERSIVLTAQGGDGLHKPLLESDIRDARAELATDPGVYAATIDAHLGADHTQDLVTGPELNNRRSWILDLGDLSSHATHVFLLGQNRAHLTISHGERGLHVYADVHVADETALDGVFESVLSLLQRVRGSSVGIEELSAALMAELSKLSTREFGLRQGVAVQLSNAAIASDGTDKAKIALKQLSDERSWLADVVECAIECNDEEMREMAVRQSDSNALMISLLQSKLLLLLSEQAERNDMARESQSAAQAARDARIQAHERGRDRTLARWALALVLPTLWVGYWSAKVAPSVPNPWGSVLVVVGCVVFAGLGALLSENMSKGESE